MSPYDRARPNGAALQIRGSPTRRRLLALLCSLSIIAVQSGGGDQGRVRRGGAASGADPMPRLFADFQVLLDRHAATIVTRDGIEAVLVGRIGWPRVALPGGSDSKPRYAAELAEIARAVPPGRRRQRLEQRLRRRQRRWDEAAATLGLAEADLHEATLDGAVLTAAQALGLPPFGGPGAKLVHRRSRDDGGASGRG